MAFADDFTINAAGDIRHNTGSTNYTVLEMHRALQALADDAVAAGNDIVDISTLTPSDRSTDNIVTLLNGHNIDDASAIFLYDGSVTQDAGDTIYAGLVVVGAVEVGTNIIIVQDNALLTDTWTAAPNADAAANILMRKMVKTRVDGANIDGQRIIVEAREYGDTYAEFSVSMGLGNNTAALFTSADGNNTTLQATVAAYTEVTNTEGYQELEISGTAPAEPYYSQWTYNGGGGTPATPVINDVYEWAKNLQRRGSSVSIHGTTGDLFRGITQGWLYDGIVGAEPATNELYHWGTYLQGTAWSAAPTVGEKVTGGTSLAVGRILAYDITEDSVVVDTESGTWQNGEVITGFTSSQTLTLDAAPVGQPTGGGTGLVLAADSAGGDEMWIQLLKGTAPADNAICYEDVDSLRVVAVFGTVTAATVSAPFIGASTGSALLGAFGIGLLPGDASASDLFVDLDGNTVTPPNNVTFTVSGLEFPTEDRVLVGPEAATLLNRGQFALSTAVTTAAHTTIIAKVGTETPGTGTNSEDDTPNAGTIRLQGDDGIYYRITYTSYTVGSGIMTFLGCAGLTGDDAAIDNDLFISYIDADAAAATATFTSVYSGSDRALYVRARNGRSTANSPIKTFETTGTLGTSGGSATAIRTPDA